MSDRPTDQPTNRGQEGSHWEVTLPITAELLKAERREHGRGEQQKVLAAQLLLQPRQPQDQNKQQDQKLLSQKPNYRL